MPRSQKIKAYFDRQQKHIYGVIEPHEKVFFIFVRYAYVFVLPFVTSMFHYTIYTGFWGKLLFWFFVYFGLCMFYIIIIDLYCIIKRIFFKDDKGKM